MYLAIEAGDAATWSGTAVALAVAIVTFVQSRVQARRDRDVSAEAAAANHRRSEALERRELALEEAITRLGEVLEASARPGAGEGVMLREVLSRLDVAQGSGRPSDSSPPVLWDLERRGKHLFALRNRGSGLATGVKVITENLPPIHRNLPEDAVVRPNESAEFMMAATLGGPIPSEIWVRWDGQEEPVAVPVPTW